MPRIIHGDDDQIVPVDTSASGGWPLAAWDGGGAVGGQPWHCPLAANLDSTANLEGDSLESDPVAGVREGARRPLSRSVPSCPPMTPPPRGRAQVSSRLPSCRVLVRGLEALA